MKAITLIQPWATLIALGEKQIETRSWNTKHRGPLAIHAGKKIDKSAFEDPFYKDLLLNYGITVGNIPTSCVVAICDLVNTAPTEELSNQITHKEIKLGNYSNNRYGWILKNVNPLEDPIPAKGMLGLWDFQN